MLAFSIGEAFVVVVAARRHLDGRLFEAEVLYAGGDYRTYVKAQAACVEGSNLLAVVGPAGTEELPGVGN